MFSKLLKTDFNQIVVPLKTFWGTKESCAVKMSSWGHYFSGDKLIFEQQPERFCQ